MRIQLALVAVGFTCTLLLAVPSRASESREIVTTCERVIRNSAESYGGPALGSAAAEANFRECWEGAILSRDGVPANLRKMCDGEVERSGRHLGSREGDATHRQCREREMARTAPVLAAARACLAELRGGDAKFGAAAWDRTYDGCMQRSGVDRSGVTEAEPKPFGRGKVQAYLNALYHGDLPKLRAIDAELSQKLGAMYQVPGYKASLLQQVLANYLIHYPVAFRNCLPADSPKVRIGEAGERITTRGGIEVARQTFDTRRDVPVARHRYPLATRVKPDAEQSDIEDRLLKGLSGVDLEELRSRHVNQVVAEVMNGLQCTDPVVKQLDSNLIRFAPVLLPP